jgi:GNAT superfamily N-acetyltransferase
MIVMSLSNSNEPQLMSYDDQGKRRFDVHINDQNVAFAIVIPNAGDGTTWLSDLFVKPEFRGTGLTTKLMEKIFEEFDEMIYVKVAAHYDEPKTNGELIEMYKRYGFEEIYDKPQGYMRRNERKSNE